MPDASRRSGDGQAAPAPARPPAVARAPRAAGGALAGATVRRGLRVVGRGIRDEPGSFALAVVGSVLYGAGTVGTGYVLGRLTDSVIAPSLAAGRADTAAVWTAGAALAGVALATSVGVVLRRAAAGKAMYDLQARYRRAVTRQYLRLPLAWHHQHPTGQLLSNANADVEATWQVFAPLPMAIGVVVMLAVAAVAMVLADPVLAALGLLVLPAVSGANVVYQRVMAPRVVAAQQLRADVSDVAHESFDGALVVKTLGREQQETERFAAVAGRLRDANVAVGRARGVFDPLIEALPALGTIAVLGVGAARVASGRADPGDVIQIAYLLTLIAFPVRALGWVLGELPRTVVGWDRVSAVLDAGGALGHGTDEPSGHGPAAVALEGVSYGYGGSGDAAVDVLHDVSLDVAPGTTVAVVGPTGSGKSTLAGLLVRLVDPRTGRVLLDARDARELRPGGVAAVASLVSQGTFVFDDTVRGNVTLDDGDPPLFDDDAVWTALRLAQADGFVAALPAGLDTRVGERGATLSGGQRQRLALARALVRRPRLLVLDDATSAVDPRVEAAILAGLRDAGFDTTVVVVAYRGATIALADEVVHVEQGRVRDRGTDAELRGRSPSYRHLVDAYRREAEQRQTDELHTLQGAGPRGADRPGETAQEPS